jgi:hypothetical protein
MPRKVRTGDNVADKLMKALEIGLTENLHGVIFEKNDIWYGSLSNCQ